MVSVFRSGRAGDLFIVLQVDEKRGIRREGLNLYSNINIDFTDAILGATTKVVIKLFIPGDVIRKYESCRHMTSFFVR
jgi:DnaJ-class molecular chaperone